MAPSTRAAFVGACLLAAGCVRYVNLGEPPAPDQAPRVAVERLRMLESFRFRLDFHTDTPFDIGASFRGSWQAPDREAWQGAWFRAGRREPAELVAAGEIQYRREGRDWEREPRGVETRVLEQLRQALERPQFTRTEDRYGRWHYRFEPWLPLLDPGRQRAFDASLLVDPATGLPVSVNARDSSGEAHWNLRFDRFNRAAAVRLPFRAEVSARLVAGRRVGRRDSELMVRTVRQRLAETGWEWRLYRRWGRLHLELAQSVVTDRLELLVAPGLVELWEVMPLAVGERAEPDWIVGDDAAFRVKPVRFLARNGDFTARAEGLLLPEPKLELALRDSLPEIAPGNLLALVLDGRALAASAPAGRATAGFLLPVGRAGTELVAVLANGPALPVGFRVLPVGNRVP